MILSSPMDLVSNLQRLRKGKETTKFVTEYREKGIETKRKGIPIIFKLKRFLTEGKEGEKQQRETV